MHAQNRPSADTDCKLESCANPSAFLLSPIGIGILGEPAALTVPGPSTDTPLLLPVAVSDVVSVPESPPPRG
jgi:hypothetical protein